MSAEITAPVFDELESGQDYRAIAADTRPIAQQGHMLLIETHALRLALACLALRGISAVDLAVCKPQALVPARAGVRITAAR